MVNQDMEELKRRVKELEQDREQDRERQREIQQLRENQQEIQRQLQEKDEQLRGKDRQLQEQEEQTQENHRQLQEKDEQLRGKDRQLQEQEEQTQENHRQLQEKDRQLQEKEEQTRATTLHEYLGHCHKHLSESIQVQTDKSLTTQGNPSNATDKIRPDFIQPWTDFIETQKAKLEELFNTYKPYAHVKALESAHFTQTLGKRMADRKLASELDLHTAIRQFIEDPLTQIIKHLQTCDEVRDAFNLPEDFGFHNHPNPLSDFGLQTRKQPDAPKPQPSTPPHSTRPHSTSIPPRCQPDQICTYTTADDVTKVAMTAEFKPPHKLTLDHLRQVLDPDGPEIELQGLIDDAMTSPEDKVKTMVTAVLCQAFSYMVLSETQYGYITTAQAFIFLHIKVEESCKRAYFYLAEPRFDVKKHLEEFPEDQFPLHRTALCQLLAFSILALESAQKDRDAWGDKVELGLKIWAPDTEAIYKQLIETPPPRKSHASPYKPRSYKLDLKPLSRRQTRASAANCRLALESGARDGKDPPGDNGPPSRKTPTRPQAAGRGGRKQPASSSTDGRGTSSSGNRKRAFCTQSCLQGLAYGGPLDGDCPNIADHCQEGDEGNGHRLDGETFRTLLSEQMQWNRIEVCSPLGMQGARGALFKMTLPSHGYTVVAKGTISAFVQDLRHEADVYRRLTSIQGVHIPIFLGNIDLQKPFRYDVAVRIVHMMLLAWSGERLSESKAFGSMDKSVCKLDLMRGINAMHAAGISHRDIRTPNLLWNEEMQRVMIIDFDRADIVMGSNRKRKRLGMVVAKGDGDAEDEEEVVDDGIEGDTETRLDRIENARIKLDLALDYTAADGLCV